MHPPTHADFNFKLDDYCYYAEDEEKVLGIARQMEIYDPLIRHSDESVILSFFYTDRQKVLDLALFIVLPEEGPHYRYLCFYFKDFLYQAYDIGRRLLEGIPAGLLDHKDYRTELLPALNYLLKDISQGSEAHIYQHKEGSWGFTFRKFEGKELPSQN